MAVLVLATYLSGLGALLLAQATDTTAAWWPAAGVGIVAVLVSPRERRPLVLGVLAVTYALANLAVGRSLGVSSMLGLADTVELVVVVVLLERLVGGRLGDIADVWRLFAAALAGSVVAGTVISLTYWWLLGDSFWQTLSLTVPSHGASVLLVAPLAMLRWRGGPLAAGRVEVVAQVTLLVTATLITFGPVPVALGLAPLPVLVWAAVRFGALVVVVEQVLAAVAISLLTQLGAGPFVRLTDSLDGGSTRQAQLYLICLVLVGLPLAVAMEHREREVARRLATERVFRRNFTESRVPVVLVTVSDGTPRFSDCNAATTSVLHRPATELIGRPVAQHLVSAELIAAFETIMHGGSAAWEGPVGVRGEPRIRLEGTLSLLDQDQQGAFFSLHLVDVTETFELQERLQAERDYTRAVIDTASSMIVVTDVEGTIIAANPATTAMTGWTEEDLVGRRFWQALVAEHQQETAAVSLSRPDLLPRAGEAHLQTKHDGLLQVVFSADVYLPSDDGPASYVISATDVTAAREHEGLVNHLLRSARTIAFVGTDLTGRITLFNTGAEHMLGLSTQAATGRELVEFIAAQDTDGSAGLSRAERFTAIISGVGDDLRPVTSDRTWLPEGRSPLKVAMTTNPVKDTFGSLIGYLFVASDVTDSRRSQEILVNALRREREVVNRLKDLDRAKDDFVSTVSHELRTPMSSIIGSTEMLAEGMLGELLPEQQRMVEVISRNGDRLLALADDLLALAAFDHESWQDPDNQVDLREVAEESANTIASMLATRTLEVDYALPPDPVIVNGDSTHLERAVTNLLTNAVKFTPDGGSVLLALETDATGRWAILSVTDTGLGIAESELDAVFGRFYRAAEVQERAIQGSGLGLAIVRNIVESLEGRVDVDSTPGSGTTFTITLPLARAAARATHGGTVSRG